MRALLLTLIVAVPVAAQVFLPARRIAPSASVAEWTPQSIPTIRYYWVASDLEDDEVVQTWTDRIQGALLAQDIAAKRPTNIASLGVSFSGTNDWMSNSPAFTLTNAVYNAEQTIVCIIVPTTPPTGYGVILTGTGDGEGLAAEQSPTRFFYGGKIGSSSWGAFTSGTAVDVAITMRTNLNVYYTNGVQAGTLVAGNTTNQRYVGMFSGSNSFYKGYIREIIFFSNKLDVADLVLIHNYATNRYP